MRLREIGVRRYADIGWAVGRGEPIATVVSRRGGTEALYDLLEGEIVPAFYERRADGLPRKWIARMKSSIAMLCPEFNIIAWSSNTPTSTICWRTTVFAS